MTPPPEMVRRPEAQAYIACLSLPQIRAIAALYPERSRAQVARVVGCSVRSVRAVAKWLGLQHTREYHYDLRARNLPSVKARKGTA